MALCVSGYVPDDLQKNDCYHDSNVKTGSWAEYGFFRKRENDRDRRSVYKNEGETDRLQGSRQTREDVEKRERE